MSLSPQDRLQKWANYLLSYFSAEEYLKLRSEFPEYDIQVNQFSDNDLLYFIISELESYDMDSLIIIGALRGDIGDMDGLCLILIKKLLDRKKLEKSGKTHIQSLKKGIPDSLLDFIIIMMLESCHRYLDVIPGSLIVLIRERFGGVNVSRIKKKRADDLQFSVALTVGLNPEWSDRKIAKLHGIDHSNIPKWRKENEFQSDIDHADMYSPDKRKAEKTEPVEFLSSKEQIDWAVRLAKYDFMELKDISEKFDFNLETLEAWAKEPKFINTLNFLKNWGRNRDTSRIIKRFSRGEN